MDKKENKLILYKDESGRVSVNTRFADEDVWLTQEQLATIYQTTQENVSRNQWGRFFVIISYPIVGTDTCPTT
jgi:hypothetical protein